MSKLKRFTGILLSALILFSPISSFAAATDYANNWAVREISKWISNKVLQTYQNGDFRPSEPIKRIDLAIMLNKLFQYHQLSTAVFSDIIKGSEEATEVAKAVAAGNFTGDGGKFRPDDPVTRQEAAVIFSRAFSLGTTDGNMLSKFKDSNRIASWSREAVSTMVGRGFMNGIPGGLFKPENNITRAEAVKIIDNIVDDLKNQAGTYSADVSGGLVVNTKDITLKNMTIKGDLYLSEGIVNGEVKLINVRVTGRVIIKCSGDNSVALSNTIVDGSILILSPSQQVTMNGSFNSLDIGSDSTGINITGGTVGTIKTREGTIGSKVSIGSAAIVRNLVAYGEVAVTGGTRIEKAEYYSKVDKVEGGGNGSAAFTPSGSLSVSHEKVTISTTQYLTIYYKPANKYEHQTIIFNLPDGILASTFDSFRSSNQNDFKLKPENISNEGKTVTVKNVDIPNDICSLTLYNKRMPDNAGVLSFNAIADADGDKEQFLPSKPVSASISVVPAITDMYVAYTNTAIIPRWTPVTGASSVSVYYRSGTGNWVVCPADVTAGELSITEVLPDTEYEVKVVVTGGPNEGESNIYRAKTPKTTPSLTLTPFDTSSENITLTFTDNPDWRSNITGICIFDRTANTVKLFNLWDKVQVFSVMPGQITISRSVFPVYSDYRVLVSSNRYGSSTVDLQIGPKN